MMSEKKPFVRNVRTCPACPATLCILPSQKQKKARCPSEFRLATSRPLGEWSESCLAAMRPTASDEVTRGRLVSFDGFPFAFRAKNGEWRDLHFGFQVSFSMAECADSTPTKSIERVCVSPSSTEQICLLVRKLTTSRGRKKAKACFNYLESILGKEISNQRNP